MKRRTRAAIAVTAAVAVVFGSSAAALALWSDSGTTTIPAIALGGVSFDAFGQSGVTTPQYSADGAPVTLTLPGSEIVKVLDQTGLDPAPVIWRFTAEGYAAGITGLNLDVLVGKQIAHDGTATDLSAGTAAPGTILAFSTMKLYPAAVNGDCSTVPDTPATGPAQNIYLYDTTAHVLQAPGASTGDPVTQVWCMALAFNDQPDAAYTNQVQATGTAEDGTTHSAIATWSAAVAFPPSLDPLGLYVNRADVTATAEDGTTSHASATYQAMIYPDPSNEPDITLVLTPAVTSLSPSLPG